MRLQRFHVTSVAVFALVTTLASARQQTSDVQKIIDLERSDSRVMEHLDHLTNRIGPRLTGSDGFKNACDWTLSQFKAFGLSNCRLEPWGEFPVAFNRGPSSGRMITPEKKDLHFGTAAWSAGTKGVVSGLAVLAPTNDEELDAARSKLKGAWIVAAPTPTRPARPSASTTATADKPATATGQADKGAVDASATASRTSSAASDRAFREKLTRAYDEEGIAGTIRSSGSELIRTGGDQRVNFDKLPTRPSINLLASEYKDLVERLKAGAEVKLEFDIRNWFENGPITLNNVIAEIPGTEKPDEIVIVGGHLDSWDGAAGALDNGTGVSTTLEAARLLATIGAKPKRTIRFMLFGGEEEGLLGSRAWIKKHPEELPKISVVLVHDGGTNYCSGIPATAAMVGPFEQVFTPIKNLDPEMPFKVREVKGLRPVGSDHDSFTAVGVPGLFWDQKGRSNYDHVHHTQFDTYDEAIPEYQRNSSIVIAVGALGIANLPELISRDNLKAPGGNGFGGGRRLGVQLNDDMAIDELVDDGLAGKIGLLVGDKLMKIGDKTIADRDELRTVMTESPAKTTVTVQRNGKEVVVPIEFPPDTGGGGGGMTRRFGMRFGDGLTIDTLTPGGLAEQAGIQAGDKIVKVGDTAVSEPPDLFGALGSAEGKARIVVLRAGKEVTVTLTLPERP